MSQCATDIFFSESVFAFSLVRNLENFNATGKQTHSSPCIGLNRGCILAAISNTGVGYCLFVAKVFQNLGSDKRIGSTLSFLYYTSSGVGAIKQHYIMDLNFSQSKPFPIVLIEELRRKGFISSAIMLPLLIGAYIIKDNRTRPIDVGYVKKTFDKVMSELCIADRYLYLRECESSHNFVLEVCDITKKTYNFRIVHNGKVVIYCHDTIYTGTDIYDNNIAVNYLLDKYIAVLGKYCNFSDKEGLPVYAHLRELDIKQCLSNQDKKQECELDVIKSILTK